MIHVHIESPIGMHRKGPFKFVTVLLPGSVLDCQGATDSTDRVAFRVQEIGRNESKGHQTLAKCSEKKFNGLPEYDTHLVNENLTVQRDGHCLRWVRLLRWGTVHGQECSQKLKTEKNE